MNRVLLFAGIAVLTLLAAWLLFGRTTPSEPLAPHTRQVVTPEEVTPAKNPTFLARTAPRRTSDRAAAAEASGPAGDALADDEALDRAVPQGLEISVWPATVEGVRGAILEITPGIQRCYQDALLEVPDLSGRIAVAFTVEAVDGVGRMVESRIDDDTLRDGPMSDCVARSVQALQFDPPDDRMSVTWPFVFSN